jgi:hypothetical protein
MRDEQAVALLSPSGVQTEQVNAIQAVHLDSILAAPPTANELETELGFDLPAGTSEEVVAWIRHQLHDLGRQWRDLDDGGSITLTYPGFNI